MYAGYKISSKRFIFSLVDELAGETRRAFAKVQTVQINHFQHQESEKVTKRVAVAKIKAIPAICR